MKGVYFFRWGYWGIERLGGFFKGKGFVLGKVFLVVVIVRFLVFWSLI